jgi:hypothetical protein
MRTISSRLAVSIDALVAVGAQTTHSRSSANCDVVDRPPLLCVSGSGDQTYSTNSYWGTVDLGGNDAYENSTGVGACVGDIQDNEADPCVGVSVDLGGGDVYSPGSKMRACEIAGLGPQKGICAQGAGLLGIGMLVDAAGNDRYEAMVQHKDEDCLGGQFQICGVIDAQATARFGVGVLADLAGNDSYSVRVPLPPADAASDQSTSLFAQGVSTFGTALLWDDAGNDKYEVTGSATGYKKDSSSIVGWSTYSAQAATIAGEAIVLDSGGSDAFSLLTQPGPGAGDRTGHDQYGEGAASGLSNISGGQGVGLPGFNIPSYGALITGEGSTTYTIDMGSRLASRLEGQGSGQGGILDDAGGDDAYLLFAHAEAEIRRDCGCSEPTILKIAPLASAQGQGSSGGTLNERSGNDKYEVRATAEATGTTASANEVRVEGGTTSASGQGIGTGVLTDRAGNDTYLATASNAATALAPELGGSASATVDSVMVLAQGTTGLLRDLGGRDSYRIEGRPQATATPSFPGSENEGYYRVQGQGLHYALFYDLDSQGGFFDSDAGEPDDFAIESDSLFEMCGGIYGQDPGWVSGQYRITPAGGEECNPTASGALVTSGDEPRAASTLTISSVAPYNDDLTRVDVELKDASGAPLAGERVRVSPEGLFGEPYYVIGPLRRWFYLENSVEITTDQDGKAAAFLPTNVCVDSCENLRWFATYYGNATHDAAADRS